MTHIENDIRHMTDEQLVRQTEYLTGFMLPDRFEVLRRTLEMRTRYLTVCMENTFHPQNASALVRNCEAFGLQEIHAVQENCEFSPNVNIVRGTDKWVDIRKYASTPELIARLRREGYRIVATTPHTDDSTPETFEVTAGPFALFFGTEHAGISEEVRAEADEFLKIPMYGFVESLNVSASAAILLYMLSSRVRESGCDWPLDVRSKREILFRWVRSSVKDAERILKRMPTEGGLVEDTDTV